MDLNVHRFEFHPTYVLAVGLAMLVGLLVPVTRHIAEPRLRRQYYGLQLVTFLSAILGAKLVFLVAEFGWPWEPLPEWSRVLGSGRSLVGAILFGLLGAECAKPLVRYPLPPNDRFAALVPFSFAVGRLGCFTTGCCQGIPCEAPWAIAGADGVARHPAPLYEIAFHLTAGVVAVFLVRRKRMIGCVFSLYLIGYGAFRFLTEFIRETPKTFATLSAYQWFCLAMIVAGTVLLIKRRFFPPSHWPGGHDDRQIAAG